MVSREPPKDDQRFGLTGVAIKEEVEESLQRMLKFSAWVLDHVDALRRISDVVIVVTTKALSLGVLASSISGVRIVIPFDRQQSLPLFNSRRLGAIEPRSRRMREHLRKT